MINQCKNMFRCVLNLGGKMCIYAKLTVFGLVRFRASVNQLPAIIYQVNKICIFTKNQLSKIIT